MGRGGSRNAAFRWDKADQTAPPGLAGTVSEDENWERIDTFLAAVVPVATAAKVRLACHPHDPYTPPVYRGVTRVLGTVAGLQRFVTMHESPYHGLNFCQGTVGEMLDDPGREIFDVIRWFGTRGKLFNVHFRNIRGHKLSFMEVFPDEGDMDMVRSLAVYKEVGYQVHGDAGPRAGDRRTRSVRDRVRLLLRVYSWGDAGTGLFVTKLLPLPLREGGRGRASARRAETARIADRIASALRATRPPDRISWSVTSHLSQLSRSMQGHHTVAYPDEERFWQNTVIVPLGSGYATQIVARPNEGIDFVQAHPRAPTIQPQRSLDLTWELDRGFHIGW